jgi:hypothetical protein
LHSPLKSESEYLATRPLPIVSAVGFFYAPIGEID